MTIPRFQLPTYGEQKAELTAILCEACEEELSSDDIFQLENRCVRCRNEQPSGMFYGEMEE